MPPPLSGQHTRFPSDPCQACPVSASNLVLCSGRSPCRFRPQDSVQSWACTVQSGCQDQSVLVKQRAGVNVLLNAITANGSDVRRAALSHVSALVRPSARPLAGLPARRPTFHWPDQPGSPTVLLAPSLRGPSVYQSDRSPVRSSARPLDRPLVRPTALPPVRPSARPPDRPTARPPVRSSARRPPADPHARSGLAATGPSKTG